MLSEIIRTKMYEAMKNKDKDAKKVYSMVISEFKNKEIALRHPLTESDEIEVITKMVKQAKDAIASVPDGARPEFIEERNNEIKILSEFLPAQLSSDEILEVIKTTMVELNIVTLTNQNKGILLKNIMPKLKNKADGREISNLVSSLIS